jgi:hypothetical protein
VVIWLTSLLADRIAREAPDFWSWRSAFYAFGSPRIEIKARDSAGEVYEKTNVERKRAVNLVDSYNMLDGRPLGVKDSAYYAPRPSVSLDRLKERLVTGSKDDKILVAGPRGGGKSTELTRLTLDLKEKFIVDCWSSISLLDTYDLHYADLLLALAVSLFRKRVELGIRLEKKFIGNLTKWLQKTISSTSAEVRPGDLTPGKLSPFFSALLSKYRFSRSLRDELRAYFRMNLNSLLDMINQIIDQVERSTSREVLVIIDDLDKLPLEKTTELFIDYGEILTRPKCKIIYSCSLACRCLPKVRTRLRINFDDFYYVHNIMTKRGNGFQSQKGTLFLKKIILKRIDENLIEPDALDEAVYMSGGNIRELLHIVRGACLEALNTGKKIRMEHIDESIRRLRMELSRPLKKDDYLLLNKIYREKKADDEWTGERFLALVFSNSIAGYEHEDGSIWFDVHPILEELLSKDRHCQV